MFADMMPRAGKVSKDDALSMLGGKPSPAYTTTRGTLVGAAGRFSGSQAGQ